MFQNDFKTCPTEKFRNLPCNMFHGMSEGRDHVSMEIKSTKRMISPKTPEQLLMFAHAPYLAKLWVLPSHCKLPGW